MQETSKEEGKYGINSEPVVQLVMVVIALVHLGGTEDRLLLALPTTAGKDEYRDISLCRSNGLMNRKSTHRNIQRLD